jgi:hypothetical protein
MLREFPDKFGEYYRTNIQTSVWDLCCDNCCLFGPKEAAYFSQVLSDKFCPLHSKSCAYCSRCLARLSAGNKPSLFRAESRELLAEKRQSDRVQCSRYDKQRCSPFLLPYPESVQTVMLCRFWLQSSHGLRRGSAAARLLGSWVWIPSGAWRFVSCTVVVLSGRGLCDGLIPRPEESYRLWRVFECDQVQMKNPLHLQCYK